MTSDDKGFEVAEVVAFLQATHPEKATAITRERLGLLKIISRLEQEKAAMGDAFRNGFRKGWEKGVRDFAIWRNGEQLVGCMERPLRRVLAEGPTDMGDMPDE